MSSVITLTTDFGLSDAYVASMKGIILDINPKATIVDISHLIEPQNILQAAFTLHMAHRYFPNGTIHVVIVDPSVGSQRRAIILKTPSAYFLAPDNGVLSYVFDELCPAANLTSTQISTKSKLRNIKRPLNAVYITNPAFWYQPVSTTFHGRDIFAPVAAHLSTGLAPQEFGEVIDSIYTFPIPQPYYDSDGNLVGYILHTDNFGNLITNIKDSDVPREESTIKISNQSIHGINRFYAEKRGLAVIIGSSGYLEISFSNGNAATFLGAKVGDKVKIITQKRE